MGEEAVQKLFDESKCYEIAELINVMNRMLAGEYVLNNIEEFIKKSMGYYPEDIIRNLTAIEGGYQIMEKKLPEIIEISKGRSSLIAEALNEINPKLITDNAQSLIQRENTTKIPSLLEQFANLENLNKIVPDIIEGCSPYETHKLIEVMEKIDKEKLLMDNIDTIIDKSEGAIVPNLVESILKMENDKGVEIIYNKFDKLLDKCDPMEYHNLLKMVQPIEEKANLFTKNEEKIIENCSDDRLVSCLKVLSENETIKKEMQNKDIDFILDLYDMGMSHDLGLTDKGKGMTNGRFIRNIIENNLAGGIKGLFEHLKDSEEDKISFINKGNYTYVFRVNRYIIKIGREREHYKIPYHEKIRQPLLRDEVRDKNGNVLLTIEVQRPNAKEKPTKQQVMKLADDLEKDNIITTDLRYNIENAGILDVGDNNQRVIPKGDTHAGIEDHEEIEDHGMKPGDVVEIDTDWTTYKEEERE